MIKCNRKCHMFPNIRTTHVNTCALARQPINELMCTKCNGSGWIREEEMSWHCEKCKGDGYTIKPLSQDANDLAGGLFFSGSNTETIFHMEQSRPTERCQIALDELLAADYLESEPFGAKGVRYAPTDKMKSGKFKSPTDTGLMIVEDIPQ